jgi:N-acyl-D-amino-acid deacylase
MPTTYDLVVRGATLIDGTGAPGAIGDLAVRDDTIVAVGNVPPGDTGREINGAGRILAPGFIDIHTHSDRTLFVDPTAESKIRMGITTEVFGNCGLSPTPCFGALLEEERRQWAKIGLQPTFGTMGEYLDRLTDNGVGLNVRALIGHAAIRKAVMGYDQRAPDAAELKAMCRHMAETMEGGGAGMSFGGITTPGTCAEIPELVEISREVARADGIVSVHLRNERERILEAMDEWFTAARETGARIQFSHHKAASPRVWGITAKTLAAIDQANADGFEVDLDQYPYGASSVGLHAMLPHWAFDGGPAALRARLTNPADRKRILDDLRGPNPSGNGSGIGPDKVMAATCLTDPSIEGKTLAELGAERGADPYETLLDLLLANELDIGGIYFTMSEDDIKAIMRHPRMMVGSDSYSQVIGGRSQQSKPHPRNYGAFARVLGHYTRDEGVLTWEEAIERMTSRPARKLRLHDRGTLAVGNKADLALFDPARVRDRATFADPDHYSEGFELVVVNGRIALDGDRMTGTLAGSVLR